MGCRGPALRQDRVGGGHMVKRLKRCQVSNDEVLRGAVLDHMVLCDACGRSGPCVQLARLRAFARIAAKLRSVGANAVLHVVDPVLGRAGAVHAAWRCNSTCMRCTADVCAAKVHVLVIGGCPGRAVRSRASPEWSRLRGRPVVHTVAGACAKGSRRRPRRRSPGGRLLVTGGVG